MASEGTTSNVMVSGDVAYFRKTGSMTNFGTIDLPDGNTARSYGEGYVGPNSVVRGTDLSDTTEYKRCETAMKTFLGEDWEEDPEEETIITNANNIKVRLSPEEIKMQTIADLIVPDYTELEYIQSANSQYINTNIQCNIIGRIETKFSTLIIKGYNWMCGASSSTGAARFNTLGIGLSSNEGNNGFCYNSVVRYTFNSNTIYDIDYKMKSGEQLITVNNTNYTGSYTGTITPCMCYIFGLNYGDSGNPGWAENNYFTSLKLYKFKIYATDQITLIRDFIPVKDKNDVVCLYDKVSKTYFYNAGTGTFTAGPEKV